MSMLLRRHTRAYRAMGATNEKAKVAPKPTPTEKKSTEKKADEIALTAKDIKLMTGAKLRKLAKQYGIENPEELTVGELKAVMCEKVSQ